MQDLRWMNSSISGKLSISWYVTFILVPVFTILDSSPKQFVQTYAYRLSKLYKTWLGSVNWEIVKQVARYSRLSYGWCFQIVEGVTFLHHTWIEGSEYNSFLDWIFFLIGKKKERRQCFFFLVRQCSVVMFFLVMSAGTVCVYLLASEHHTWHGDHDTLVRCC